MQCTGIPYCDLKSKVNRMVSGCDFLLALIYLHRTLDVQMTRSLKHLIPFFFYSSSCRKSTAGKWFISVNNEIVSVTLL